MDSSVKLQSLLAKVRDPLSQVTLEVELFGLFSLPDAWKPADQETTEYTNHITVAGIQFPNGKVRRRELTEEEIKAAEESKKGKKQEAPKKKGQDEPSAEELEEIERHRRLKAEEQQQRELEWAKLDEETKFYRTNEDIFKSPCIAWEQENHEDSRHIKSYTLSLLKEEADLVELEEHVEDEGGLYLEFSRVPKVNEEDNKKKAPKAKVVEEPKPAYGRAWIDLTELKEIGRQEVYVRTKLQDKEDVEIPYFTAETYIYLRLKVTPPITPISAADPSPSPQDLIPPKAPVPKFQPSKDATHDFRRQIKLATKAIAAEYHHMFSDQLGDNQRKLAVARQKELRESRKETFLYDFNLSGKAQILKTKLKKSIVKIAREKFRKVASLKGLNFTDKDQYFSELYAYLTDQMQLTVDEVVSEYKNQLHEDIVIPRELAAREKETLLASTLHETTDERLSRLAFESEINRLTERANAHHKERACREPRNISIWMDYARFCLRNGDISRAEEALREVISISGNDVLLDHLILLGALYVQRRRFHEAALLLHGALEKDFFHVIANLVTSLLYKLSDKPGLEKKYSAISKRLCMRHLGLLPKKGNKSGYNSSLEGVTIRVETAPGEYMKNLSPAQVDDMYYFLVDYFLKEKLIELAQRALEEISDKESSVTRYTYCNAQILFWKGEYQQCADTLAELLQFEPRHEQGWILRGNALYFLNSNFDAEESYLKAIRYSSKGPRSFSKANGFSESLILLRLGQIYIKRRAWSDAKIVFSRCCEESATALSWEGLGLACLQLNEVNEAEDALTQANMMNDKNSYTWGALSLLCLKRSESPPGRYVQFRQCLKEAFDLKLDDSYLLMNIGHEYVKKFYLDGSGIHAQKLDHNEPLLCYQKASEILKNQGKPVDDLKRSISDVFDYLKTKGNNKLDHKLIESIERSKEAVINNIS